MKMVAHRLAASLALIVSVPAITFGLEAITPGNAVDTRLGIASTPQHRHALAHQLGLDKPVWDRYLIWFEHLLHGNLGTSVITGESVTHELNSRLPVSLSLIIGATTLTAIAGIAIGIASAKGSGLLGRTIDGASALGVAVPNFWLGVILVELLAVELHAFPAIGYVPFNSSPTQWLRSLVLPVVTLSFVGITAVAKQTRDQLKEVLERDFIRSLRANGVPERSIIYRHALRSASIPVVTVLGLLFVGALGGSVIVENIFVLPGLGSAAVQATSSQDFPVILGISVYFTLLVIAVNVVVDLATLWLNPKVRSR
jgi:peptide/nickel transport system permease protein